MNQCPYNTFQANRTPRGIIAGRSRVRMFVVRSRLTAIRMQITGGSRTIRRTNPIYIDFQVLFLVFLLPDHTCQPKQQLLFQVGSSLVSSPCMLVLLSFFF